MASIRWRTLALPALTTLLLATGCPGGSSGKGNPGDTEVGGVGEVQSGFVAVGATETEAEEQGPAFGLREATSPEGRGYRPVPSAEAKPLSEADTKTLLGRLPDLQRAETKDFARREGPPPPKLTGDTIKTPFPPPTKPDVPPAAEPGPLKVLRYQPEGDVPLAPHVSLTFSRPMVAVGSVGDLAEGPFPARLSPAVPGRWRWLGTRTLVFEPEGERFPMATVYQVEVPAGVAAADGTKLGEAQRWSFRTPSPKVVSCSPQGGPTVREPLLLVRFDQRVDAAAVLGSIKVQADGEPIELRLATQDELAGRVIPQPERQVAFRPTQPLPGDAQIRVDVGPGTPSAEGPRRTEQAHTFTFRTYGPLKIVKHRSGWGRDCPPGAPFTIRFNNPLDAKAFAKERFSFEPEIEALDAACHGNQVILRGLTRANTRYTCTVSAKLRDRFEQTLGQDQTLTFQTTAPRPQLSGIGQQVLILDPSGDPELEVRSIAIPKLQVRVYRVDPARDYGHFQSWSRNRNRRGAPPLAGPGTKVLDEVVDVPGSDEAWVKTKVDVSKALAKGLGHAVVSVEPLTWKNRWKPRIAVWVQATQLGVSVARDAKEALAWVTRLEDGAPVGGAQVRFGGGPAVSADDSGLARLPLGSRRDLLLASQGGDTVLLPGYWRASNPSVSLRWFSFDDRHLYRPKETVQVKGWVRRYDAGEGGDVLPLGTPPRGDWRVIDAHGQEIAKGRADFDAWGSFTLSFELPDTIHVGQARLLFNAGHTHPFQVAEFRRPEFEVQASVGSAGPHFGGESLTLSAKASYFAGGALPNAPVKWKVEARPGSFTPPNRKEFAFGNYVPWWARRSYGRVGRGRHAFGPSRTPALHTQHLAGRTDATGKHHVAVDLRATKTPLTISASATVQDVNRQAWAGSTAVLVHPADVYVGLKLGSPYVGSGRDLILDALVVDHDGEAVSGREVALVLEKVRWVWREGRYSEEAASRLERKLTSKGEAERVVIKAPKGGFYRITATVSDAQGRQSVTTSQVWVAGGEGPSSRKVEEERVTLIPDQQSYQGGDTARLLVISPFAPAEGLLTLRRSGIVETRRFHMKESTTVLEVAIQDEHVPNLEAHVALVGKKLRSGEKARTRPAFAAGRSMLKVPPTRRTLSLSVKPAHRELVPGSETSAEVVVLDHEGRPVPGAQVALAVVDEAILSLAGHSQPDPLAVFYAPRPAGASDARVRALLRLQAPKLPEEQARLEEAESLRGNAMADGAPQAPGGPRRRMAKGRAQERGGGGGGGGASVAGPAIDLRKDLRALAVFAPAQVTDAAGKTTVRYTLPDSLTRYRLVAVAAGKTHRFGSSEATLTARLPLQVRPSPPRFLNFGDRCELPIVLQNQTDAPLEVVVAIRASNLSFSAGQGRTLTLPPRDRREVRFPAAAVEAGEVRLQVAAAAGKHVDAQELTFPVWTPATSEAFATYGTLDGGATATAQPVAPPKDAWPQFGGLEITTSSTGLSALTDAVIYLSEYPYGCAEQVSSRVIALAAVRDVLQAFEAAGSRARRSSPPTWTPTCCACARSKTATAAGASGAGTARAGPT